MRQPVHRIASVQNSDVNTAASTLTQTNLKHTAWQSPSKSDKVSERMNGQIGQVLSSVRSGMSQHLVDCR